MEMTRIPSPLHYARSYGSGLADPGARRLGLRFRRLFDAPATGESARIGETEYRIVDPLRENRHFMGMHTRFVVLRGLV